MGVYGMTYDEFWRDDPMLALYYREAWIERRKAENHRDWLLGAYYYNAIATALGNAFKKKGSKAEPYLEEPFPIFPLTKEEEEAKAQKEKEKIEAVYTSIMKQQRERKLREQAHAKEQEAKDAEVRGS